MQASAQNNYLETEVMTAPPQKLQLMLVEAAIRAAERARAMWRDEDDEQAFLALIRAQEITGELLAGLNPEVDSDVVKKVASVYMFVFRRLAEASRDRDEKTLDDAIRVLHVERETWRQVCRQLSGSQPPETFASPGIVVSQTSSLTGPSADSSSPDDLTDAGLSLEA